MGTALPAVTFFCNGFTTTLWAWAGLALDTPRSPRSSPGGCPAAPPE
eukprot:CAMPEP_0204498154 /NCGR_PEP_ID=MMETSP0471-20130131/92359_1 /ASSEMBLY_ACC=CAM_ASM_000602 /TAXON_ID=2969 /ORGANISM="Oxyrrhis marina" /LENGTH=46 /DNA_ID= /DNA_START= /DNA_END= /DNA_ORIENTATION=